MVWLRRHPVIRAVLGIIAAIVLTTLLVGGAFIVVMKGRDIAVPQSIQSRMIDDLNRSMNDVTLDVSNITVGLSQTWQPVFNLLQLGVRQGDNPSFVQLNTVSAQISLDQLMRGHMRVSRLELDGANIAAKRSSDGRVTFQFGELGAPDANTFDPFVILRAIDVAASGDALSNFERFDLYGLSVQYDDLKSDQSFLVDGARLAVARENDEIVIRGDLALLNGGAGVSTLELNYKSPIGTRKAEFGILLTDIPAENIASQSEILAWLKPLEATISGALRSGLSANGDLMPINGTLQIAGGVVRPNETVRPIPFDGAQTYFTYDPINRDINFSDISVKSRDLTLTATGYSRLTVDDAGGPQFMGQLQITKLQANPFALFPSPITATQARIDYRMALDPFIIDVPQIFLEDQKSKSRVIADANLRADPTGWNIGLSARVPEVGLETILGYWPEAFKEKPRAWVATNIHTGQLRDVTFSMRAQNQEPPETATSFWFENTDFHFLPDMPIVTDASGVFSSYDFRTTVTLQSGVIRGQSDRPINMAGSTFTIPDARIKPSPATAEVHAQGGISDILTALNNKPLFVLDKIGRAASIATGDVTASAQVDFLLKQGLSPNEISYHVDADLKNVVSSTLVPNRKITANSLTLSIDQDVMTISGSAALDGVGGSGRYTAYLGPTYRDKPANLAVQARVGLDDLTTLGIPIPTWAISGTTDAQFDATFKKGRPPKYRVTSNLAGSTLKLPQMSWSKPADTAANLVATGQFDGINVLESLTLDAPGLFVTGRGIFRNSAFQALALNKVNLGKTFEGSVEITNGGALSISSDRVDLTSVLKRYDSANNSGQKSTGRMTVHLDRLDITDKIYLGDFVLDIDPKGGGTFTGLVNRNGRVTGLLGRKNGQVSVTIKAADAGKTLVSAGIMKRASGGTMVMDIMGTGRSGEFDGTVTVKDIRVQNAPVLIDLLNAVSVVGLLDQLTGAGLLVNEINTKFRNTPSQIIVESASMFGPSLGMTVDGYYDKDNKALDFQGVLSPIYVLNGIGAIFSKKGEGLIGFNFNVGGTTDKPKVAVNPLSIFTPAMFREIFRRPPPKLE